MGCDVVRAVALTGLLTVTLSSLNTYLCLFSVNQVGFIFCLSRMDFIFLGVRSHNTMGWRNSSKPRREVCPVLLLPPSSGVILSV